MMNLGGPIPDVDLFGPGARLDHVGMAVKSIEKTMPGAPIVTDPVQKVRVTLVRLHGTPIELVEPTAPDSPVVHTLGQGRAVYHLCFQVPDLEASLARALDRGFVKVSGPVPAVAFEGKRIVWLLSKTYGLVELVES